MSINKKTILIVVDSIDIDDSSGSKANVALINNLNKTGFKLKIFHYSRKDINLSNIECISIKEQKFNGWFLLSRVQRVFTRVTKININPKVEKYLGFSFTFFNDAYSIKKALKNTNDFNPNYVLTLSYASSFRPHKALLSFPKWHNKWLAYVHDPYPMHSYPRPYDWVEPGHQFKRNFFLKIVEKSKFVVYPSKLLAEWMQSYYPKQKGKEIIIPHQIVEGTVKKNTLPNFFNISKFNMLHAGNMMSARNPTILINAFKHFLKQNPTAKENVNLIFVGKSSIYDDFMRDKKKTMPELITSDGYLPFETVLKMQQLTSVNVILEALGPISPFLPGKFPHCIQAEKPILLLSPYYSESKRLLGESYPYWSAIDDINLITKHITKLYNEWLLNDKNLHMKRVDLRSYLGTSYLKKTFDNLKV